MLSQLLVVEHATGLIPLSHTVSKTTIVPATNVIRGQSRWNKCPSVISMHAFFHRIQYNSGK